MSLVVPVLYAAGRTFDPVTPSVMRHLPQNGFTLRIVLPARMSVMMYDVARAMMRSPVVLVVGSGQTTLPCASVTFSIVWRGISTPPLAMAPYAEIIWIGCVSRVPMLSDTTGAVPLGNVSPKSLNRLYSWSTPLMIPALIAGMLSENWSALRRRTGPRSAPSAWVG